MTSPEGTFPIFKVVNNSDTCTSHEFKDICDSARHVHPLLLVALWCPVNLWVSTAPLPCYPVQVVRYEAGYVVCAVIAGLYLLLVPTAGLCFYCCRGHRRRGGRAKMEHKEVACERSLLMTFLLLTTLVLL